MNKEEIPYAVQRFMENLYKVTKVEATVVHEGEWWHVEHRNERVVLTRSYHYGPRGSNQTNNTLTVDGKKHALASGFSAYAKIFTGRTVETTIDDDYFSQPMEELPPGDFVPAIVQATMASVQASLKRSGRTEAVVRAGRLDHFYVIEVSGGKAIARFWFQQVKKGRYAPDKRTPISVIDSGGKDITNEVGSNLEEILLALLGTAPTPDAKPTIGRPRQAPGTANSVSVRKTTVIRN